MRQMFPRACYLGFTGTPLMKKERNNFLRFGGLIDPSYSMKQAVDDKQVVPLLYEGRHVVMDQDQAAIDLWFDRYTRGLTDEQQADLKKKYARAEMLSKADRVMFMRAFDISEHFRANWQGTGFKAQLVAPNKRTAITYQAVPRRHRRRLQRGAHLRAGHARGLERRRRRARQRGAQVLAAHDGQVRRRGGLQRAHHQPLQERPVHPEILIVVDKLLTGFDAPRNTVLYLCRGLREHTLLQAVARVNRLCEGKEFGYVVDYEGTLGDLDQALDHVRRPGRLRGRRPGRDHPRRSGGGGEAAAAPRRPARPSSRPSSTRTTRRPTSVLLADQAIRDEFYERLSAYARSLGIALSTEAFVMDTSDEKIRALQGRPAALREPAPVGALRYAETVDYGEYEPKIKKLLDTHISADEVIQLNEPVNIFDAKLFDGGEGGTGDLREGTAARPTPSPTRPRRSSRKRWTKTRPFTRNSPS